MDNILLNDDFLDLVSSQMQKNSNVLDKIGEYKKYNKEYSQINAMVEKMTEKNIKLFFDKIVNCYDFMSIYENAFAYYLGMKQGLGMAELEKS